MTSKPNILLIEDDLSLTELIKYNLTANGFDITCCDDGEEGLMQAQDFPPDLILLDWMLPNLSGIEICRRLRRNPATANVPVIMLTARAEETDRVRGLDTGADDYMTKPFSPRELIARIHAILRRIRPALAGETLTYADITLDCASHKVSRSGLNVHLGPIEFKLLRYFMENPKRVFSREQLLDSVWGHDIYVESRTVDVHIRRLRKALNGMDLPDRIRTVRGAGYSLDEYAV
jgi:two-component system phosphate regulon response regulator PhoB